MDYYLNPFALISKEDGRICFVGADKESIRRYSFDALQREVLARLTSGEAVSEQTLCEVFPAQVLDDWKGNDWLVPEMPDTVSMDSRTEAFYRAYGMTDAGQRMRGKSVLVLGCGGIGTHMAWHMVLLGVGRITLLDYDTVEQSNLNRQLLFEQGDVGSSKADTLRKKLLAIRPNADIRTICRRISSEQELDDICAGERYDLIIKALDSPAQFPAWLDAVCKRRRIAYTAGITMQEKTLIGPTFLPGVSEIGISDILPVSNAGDRLHGISPSMGVLLYHISDALAVECFKLLSGYGDLQYCGKMVAEDLFSGTAEEYGPAAKAPHDPAAMYRRDHSILSALGFALAGVFHWAALPIGWLVLFAELMRSPGSRETAVRKTFILTAVLGLAAFVRVARMLRGTAILAAVSGMMIAFGVISFCVLGACAVCTLFMQHAAEK